MGREARFRVAGEAVGRWGVQDSALRSGVWCGQRGGAEGSWRGCGGVGGPGLRTGGRGLVWADRRGPGERRPCGLTLLPPPQHHREEWTPFRGARCLPFHSSAQSPVSGQGWAEGVGGPSDLSGCWACAPPPSCCEEGPDLVRDVASPILLGLFRISFRDDCALGTSGVMGSRFHASCYGTSWVPAPFFFLEFRHIPVQREQGTGACSTFWPGLHLPPPHWPPG